MKRDPRNLLALAFVLGGAVPIVVWVAGWARQSLTVEAAIQAGLIAVLLLLVWRIRVGWEKKTARGRKEWP